MKIQAFVKSLDDVDDEGLRTHYREVDGGFVFVPEGFDSEHRDYYDSILAPGLKSALEKERTNLREVKDALSEFKKLGMPQDKLKALVEAAAAKSREAESKNGEIQQMRDIHRQEKETWEKEVGFLRKQLESSLLTSQVQSAIAAEGGSTELLTPYVERFVRLERDGDQLAVRVFGEDGKTVRVGDADGNPMTPRQFVASLRGKEPFKVAFKNEVHHGGGTPPVKNEARPASGKVRSLKDLKTDAEKVAFIRTNGLAAFQALSPE